MKYAFIQRHRKVWPISVQCRVLELSVAGYHEHLVRRASSAQRRHLSDDALLVHIKAIHAQSRGSYGWPRTWRELVARGIPVGKDRVQKLIQLHGIRVKGKRRFKVTTDSGHALPISPNLLNREFTVAEPDRVWVGDITYIATGEGWLFLAVVIDLKCSAPPRFSVRLLEILERMIVCTRQLPWQGMGRHRSSSLTQFKQVLNTIPINYFRIRIRNSEIATVRDPSLLKPGNMKI